ncbi:MAG: alpha/beta fold hydrolase, partial [Anaerolineales bacterium]|nr:alpha/beta fold hydrolase [Anaerolineales bacterium]
MGEQAAFTQKHAKVDGHKLFYLQAGEGETVLLIHGITTYSFIWQNVMPLLSQKYRVIAIDLLGCGKSDKPLDISYGLTAHAKRLVSFLRELNISKIHLVGHDLGGGIAQIMAVNHESLFYDMTLANRVGYAYWPVQPITALRAPIIRQLIMASLDLGIFQLIIKRALFHKERLTPELMAQFSAPLATREGRKAFLHFARSLDNRNLTEIEGKLRTLKIPTLIIHGENDVFLNINIAKQL